MERFEIYSNIENSVDAASCADYLYKFLLGINVVFSKKSEKNRSRFLQNVGKFMLYSLTFSQEIRIAGIVILIVINLL